MSFLFGKSKKSQPNAPGLPAATRDITSSHGETRIPTANGLPGSRDALDRRPGLQNQRSGHASLESMRGGDVPAGPEPGKIMRPRAESDLSVCTIWQAEFAEPCYFVAARAIPAVVSHRTTVANITPRVRVATQFGQLDPHRETHLTRGLSDD